MNPFISPAKQRNPVYAGIASDIIPISPSDTEDLPFVASALYIEGAGTVVYVTAAGETRTVNVPDFFTLPTGAKRVLATGTNASNIHGLVI